jgi:hypothetical protein
MYMRLLMPVIECGVEGKNLPFSLDTGASGTNLSVRYYERFRNEVGSWKRGENKSFGADGIFSLTMQNEMVVKAVITRLTTPYAA